MAGQMWDVEKMPIGQAILRDDYAEIDKLVANGEDIHFKDRKGMTYLHFVCSMYKPHAFYKLIALGVNLDAQNRNGNTPLHITAIQNEACHVTDLLACGADPTIQNMMHKTAEQTGSENKFWRELYMKYEPGLYQAIGRNDIDRVREILQLWPKLDIIKEGRTPSQSAVHEGHSDIFTLIEQHKPTMSVIYGVLEGNISKMDWGLERPGCDVNFLKQDSTRSHILQYAIELNNHAMVKRLLDHNADVNTIVDIKDYVKAPLYFEVLKKPHGIDPKIVDDVIHSNCDFTLRDENGRNVLMYSLDRSLGQTPMPLVEHFMKQGLDIAQRDITGVTVRDVALFCDRPDIIRCIDMYVIDLVKSSNIPRLEQLASDGYDHFFLTYNHRDTWLYASGNSTELALQFVEYLNEFTRCSNLLHESIANKGSMKKIRALIETCTRAHMVVNVKDKAGRTPLMKAIMYERADIAEYLLELEAKLVSDHDNRGRYPLHYASALEKEGAEFEKMLLDSGAVSNLMDFRLKTAAQLKHLIETRKEQSFIKAEKLKEFGLEKELTYLLKYSELKTIIETADSTENDFSNALRSFHHPITDAPKVLLPNDTALVSNFSDLIFVAVLHNKGDIVKKLVHIGADCDRKEMCDINCKTANDKKSASKLLNAEEFAYELGLNDLCDFIKQHKLTRPKNQLSDAT
ncbi:unnamed protein product [Owenia fusiformis]|uniref:Uncharacterized protein n=1 Tax=Owenia fusiformis TaxID=6347 RepID=A0A8J1UI40_OWEFU|nr:unnamed protein product [Owenia fusiformis]